MKKIIYKCDICGKDMEKTSYGATLIHHNSYKNIQYDICGKCWNHIFPDFVITVEKIRNIKGEKINEKI